MSKIDRLRALQDQSEDIGKKIKVLQDSIHIELSERFRKIIENTLWINSIKEMNILFNHWPNDTRITLKLNNDTTRSYSPFYTDNETGISLKVVDIEIGGKEKEEKYRDVYGEIDLTSNQVDKILKESESPSIKLRSSIPPPP